MRTRAFVTSTSIDAAWWLKFSDDLLFNLLIKLSFFIEITHGFISALICLLTLMCSIGTFIYICTTSSVPLESSFAFTWITSSCIRAYSIRLNLNFIPVDFDISFSYPMAIVRPIRTFINIRASFSTSGISRMAFTRIAADIICTCRVLKDHVRLFLWFNKF